MKQLRSMEKIAESIYPYRHYFIILGFVIIFILATIAQITESSDAHTLGDAIYFSFGSIGGTSLFLGVLATQIDPNRGELRTDENDSWFAKSYNIFLKIFLPIVFIVFVVLALGITVNAWLSI
jgi:hypothetical protein